MLSQGQEVERIVFVPLHGITYLEPATVEKKLNGPPAGRRSTARYPDVQVEAILVGDILDRWGCLGMFEQKCSVVDRLGTYWAELGVVAWNSG